MKRLILGGEASGKSDYAEGMFYAVRGRHCVLSVAHARDFSFRSRILDHRKRRPDDVVVWEAGAHLPATLQEAAEKFDAVLVESLDFWVFEIMQTRRDMQEARDEFIRALRQDLSAELIFVSCEVGTGPTPADSFTRAYVRNLGKLNQDVASVCDAVEYVVAGRALSLQPVISP